MSRAARRAVLPRVPPVDGLPGLERPVLGLPLADALLVAAVAVVGVFEGALGLGPRPALTVAVLGIVVGAHLFRRRAPVLVLLAVASTLFLVFVTRIDLGLAQAGATGDLSLWVAVYTVAAIRGPRWALAAAVVQVATYLPLVAIPDACDILCVVGFSTFFLFAAVAGVAVYTGLQLNESLTEQTDLLRRTREERIRLAVAGERTRVARDLHDVVAHAVTVMVVQAGAARALVVRNADRAREALEAIEPMGRQALRELETLLGSMAPEAEAAVEDRSVRALVDQAEATGQHVELLVQGDDPMPDPGLDMSVYRIVQEALTNVRKHAPGARATVVVNRRAQGVDVEVVDTGDATKVRAVPGAGQGLIGMRERAALFGGTVEAAPTADGGFRLHAWLPRAGAPV